MSLGCHVRGATNPKPDLGDAPSFYEGVKYRFLRQPPTADEELLEEFRVFVRDFMKTNFTPLPHDIDLSVDKWLENTPYTIARKNDLKKKYENFMERNQGDEYPSGRSHKKLMRVNCFMKDETYPQYKYPRAINSRSDEFKCLVGPVMKAIEKEIFKLDWFIKKIPVALRPYDLFNNVHQEGATCIGTDYTSYEALFTKMLMSVCEQEMFEYMTQELPKLVMELIRLLDRKSVV